MITSLCVKVEVNTGATINAVAKDAIELRKKLGCNIILYFDRCEIMVIFDTTEAEIIAEFLEY